MNKEASNKNFKKTDHPDSRHSFSSYNCKMFKNQKINKKRPPKFQKCIRSLKLKSLIKQTPPRSGQSDSEYNFKIFKNQK